MLVNARYSIIRCRNVTSLGRGGNISKEGALEDTNAGLRVRTEPAAPMQIRWTYTGLVFTTDLHEVTAARLSCSTFCTSCTGSTTDGCVPPRPRAGLVMY